MKDYRPECQRDEVQYVIDWASGIRSLTDGPLTGHVRFHYDAIMESKSLTIKQLPAEVHRRLGERARRNHRSLNSEVVALLARASDPDLDVEDLLKRSDELTSAVNFVARPEDIAAFRVRGRR
ncbi:MAG: Arc family DNA-binding protein [Candidatus Eremiobacteraeota bacterium]|nr:Arc family DNA-binding protein [Candidatus Eremiobacteraeota bacterium]MBC5821009.1 Arc family DNA-binding protein [Candidatus Eremiobacteraeota bacterium]